MYPLKCQCGEYRTVPNVLICPFCFACFASKSDEEARKHLRKCTQSLSPHTAHKRGPGRPPKEDYGIQVGLHSGYKRRCTNCGFYGCQGGVEGSCERWVPMNLERCPFCGRLPEMYPMNSDYTIECGNCNVVMHGDDKEQLIARWNRV